MTIGIVIPARLNSERLPGKVLKDFLGMPMIEHVWRRAQLTNPVLKTVIATDSTEIRMAVEKFGATCILTSKNHMNGLSRVGEIVDKLQWDHYLILQADEILIEPQSLNLLINAVKKDQEYEFFNLMTKLEHIDEIDDVNIVKCIIRKDNSIITLARKSSSIAPKLIQMKYTNKICGVYASSSKLLKKLVDFAGQRIETSESIEQMRVIEMGHQILGVLINRNYPSVNTLQDSESVVRILNIDSKQQNILKMYS